MRDRQREDDREDERREKEQKAVENNASTLIYL